MKVENMTSGKGNKVPNQFIITNNGRTVFQSYQTVIAEKAGDAIYLDEKWNYSRTTQKYLNQFLGENKKGILQHIKSGKYIVTNLNC